MDNAYKNIQTSTKDSIIIRELEEIYRTSFKETETVEFKKSISEIDSALKTLCAFLNNKGGRLYFGISNSGSVVGQTLNDQNLREISQKIRNKIKPQITPKIETACIKNIPVIEVTVKKASDEIYYYNGIAYDRSGSETIVIPPDEIKRRILEANQIAWERQVFKRVSFSDLKISTINKFLKMARDAKRLPKTKENKETILRKLELITDEGITNAAIVLFGKESARYFHNTLLRCGRFKDELKEFFIDMKDYGVNAFENLENGIDFLKEHIRISARIEGLLRVEKWEFPIPALRETIINAMIHMDYTINGSIYISIYDDRITISNPGNLIGGLTVKDLYRRHISVLRNPLIANIFYLSGLIDKWARGTLNIIRHLKKEGLSLPEFGLLQSYFETIFYRQITIPDTTPDTTPVNLTVLEERILNEIRKDNKISRTQVANNLGISLNTIKEYIAKLKKKGALNRAGKTSKGYWQITI